MCAVATSAFLILHGVNNHRPVGHWQHWLAGELAGSGAPVLYPQLPEPDAPVLDDWLAALAENLALLAAVRADERVVVAHSLGCVTWARAVERGLVPPGLVDRVLLVAPPSPVVLQALPTLAPFATGPYPDQAGHVGAAWAVLSDDDPYAPEGLAALLPHLPADRRIGLSGQGHLTPADGYGAWPSLLAWCRDPGAALVAASVAR